ncbi:hypothetical protein C0Q70_06828 [Pomacea canaliculata]|uniref:2-methoxy-6-polyprenyl-1,4-benzoquinol methylase, mitochondrial n=1 Tax=Pomacea canaliculata TaxID=400727 RepID=A0A2T7PDB5_POMCA|nr:hypothetical protein C0Q70_06828 [Pomacea canaliculata]
MYTVYEVFENVAKKYDLMNDAMSIGVHRLWKDHFMQRLSPTPGTKLLDAAGGTAHKQSLHNSERETGTPVSTSSTDATDESPSSSSDDESSSTGKNEWRKALDEQGSHVTVCDINQPMLDVGKQKALRKGYKTGISWVQGNAESLPFPDASFDAYTIAFGIRNCTNVQKVLDEAYRVLRRGGRFMCLEFSQVTNPVLRSLYDSYSFQVIPVMGQVIANDWKSYQYLVESIRQFPNQEGFAAMIRNSGFRMVTYENLTFGVAAIHSGFKL